jgi:hypothetical protein
MKKSPQRRCDVSDIKAIRKRHKENTGYIANREKQGRWWWLDMHQYCHNDRAVLLKRVAHLDMRLAGVCWRNGHDNTEINYEDTSFLRCRVCDMNEVDQAEEIA